MPAKGKQTVGKQKVAKKIQKAVKKKGAAPPGKAVPSAGGDLAVRIARLVRDVDAIKSELSRRPASGGDGSGSCREHEKFLADRLARLDEKVDAVWHRLADLEERIEGEGAKQKHDADEFDDPPEKDYYER